MYILTEILNEFLNILRNPETSDKLKIETISNLNSLVNCHYNNLDKERGCINKMKIIDNRKIALEKEIEEINNRIELLRTNDFSVLDLENRPPHEYYEEQKDKLESKKNELNSIDLYGEEGVVSNIYEDINNIYDKIQKTRDILSECTDNNTESIKNIENRLINIENTMIPPPPPGFLLKRQHTIPENIDKSW